MVPEKDANAYKGSVSVSHDETIRNQFPEIFYFQVRHIIFFFEAVYLAVTAMAGHDNHVGLRGFYLLYFFATVENSFFIITGGEGTSAASAAELMTSIRIQVDPVFKTLIHYPSGLIIKPVTKKLFGVAGIIAGIMLGRQIIEF